MNGIKGEGKTKFFPRSFKIGGQICTVTAFLAVLSSCSFAPTPIPKSKDYDLNLKSQEWKSIDPDSSDHAFENSSTHSIMLVNSQCEKYESSSLDKLNSGMMSGIDNLQVINKESTKFASRDALLMQAKGSLDGVPVFLKTLTLRKDRCLYDLVLIANSQDTLKKDDSAFEELLKGFSP